MKRLFFAVFFILSLPLVAQTGTERSSSNAEWLDNHEGGSLTTVLSETDAPPVTKEQEEKGVHVRDYRIGFVNFRRIMASVPQLSDIRTRLEHEFAAEENALLTAQRDLAMLEQKLTNMERGADYSTYEKQVIVKRRDVARRDAAFRDSFSVRRNEELAKLQKLIADEIIELAKTEGYDVILNDTGVFYVSERADLSSVVINRLIKKATKD